MIMTLIGILLILWLIGLIAHIAGAFVNILLLVALIIFVYDRLIGSRAAK
jgi:hypothetical protein